MGKTASRLAILLLAGLPACALTGRAPPAEEVSARAFSFAAGVAALDQADFASAARHLATVAAICPVDGAGRRAMLLLAAAELDPRNETGRPDAAAQLSAFQIMRPDGDELWAAVLGAELYALALDYGATAIAREDHPGASILWTHYLNGEVGAAADDTGGEPLAGEDTADAAPATTTPVVTRTARVEEHAHAGGPLCDVPGADPDIALPRLARPPIAARVQETSGEGPAPSGRSADVRALMAENDRLRAELASKEQELDRIRRTLRP